MSSSVALVVMARYPEVGAVKTRLARCIGARRACDLYRAFLQDIATRFSDQRRALVWAYYPGKSAFRALVAPRARCLPQIGSTLGERMQNCFAQLFDAGLTGVIMIGADVPHLRTEWLDEAEAQLSHADVVLGPSSDGGYYLIAMRQAHDVFSGIEMSTPEVLTDTVRKAERSGLRVHLLPPSFDIDEEPDLARLQALLRDEEMQRMLPATALVLRSWS